MAGKTCIHVSCYLCSIWLISFCVFKSSILDFGNIFLKYSNYFQSNLEPNSSFEIIFLNSYLGLIFILFLLLDLLEFCHQLFPSCKPCLSIFNSQWMLPNTSQSNICNHRSLPMQTHTYITFSLYVFILFWSLALILSIRLCSTKLLICHVFKKIWSLFGKF